jgi:RNA polymerase sigma-70 factor, ECF subfamily
MTIADGQFSESGIGQEMSDEECLLEVRSGNRSALSVLFKRYRGLVLGIASRIIRDREEAEDVVQSVFLEILQRVQLFDAGKGSAKGWLLQYAYHRSFNRRKYLALRGYYNEDQKYGPLHEPYAGFHEKDAAILLQQALSCLKPAQRRVLESVLLEGRTLREVAKEQRISLANARHYYYRGLERMRDEVNSRRKNSDHAQS